MIPVIPAGLEPATCALGSGRRSRTSCAQRQEPAGDEHQPADTLADGDDLSAALPSEPWRLLSCLLGPPHLRTAAGHRSTRGSDFARDGILTGRERERLNERRTSS